MIYHTNRKEFEIKARWQYLVGILLAVSFALALSSCAGMGVKPAVTFEERTVFVQSGVAEVQMGLKEKILTNTISKRDATNIDKQLDAAVEGLAIAIEVKDTDPTRAENRLEAAKIIVTALKGLVK